MNTGVVVHRSLPALLAERPALIVLGEAQGLSPATAGLAAAFPGRLLGLPAADATLLGVATGLALGGKQVLVELSGPASLAAIAPALAAEAARFARAEGFALSLVLRVPLAPGEALPAGLTAALGVDVYALARASEWPQLIRALLDKGQPVVLIEAVSAEGPELGGQPGAGRSLRSGADATVIAAGGDLSLALEAAEALAAEGVEVDVLDPGNLRAPALSLLAGRVNETGHVVYVGLAAQVAESVNAAAFLRLESPPQVCAPEGIASAVRAALAY